MNNIIKSRRDTFVKTTPKEVVKYSFDRNKLITEVSWYKKAKRYIEGSVPLEISEVRPLSDGLFFYTMTNCGIDAASLIFDEKITVPPNVFLSKILEIKDTIESNTKHSASGTTTLSAFFSEIFEERKKDIPKKLFEFETVKLNGKLVDNPLFVDLLADIILPLNQKMDMFIHGDLHLGNILIDNNRITLIDPRGSFLLREYGHQIYDWAKLYHDIFCGYNHFQHQRYQISQSKNEFTFTIDWHPYYINLQKEFLVKIKERSIDINQIKRCTVALLRNVLALHEEEIYLPCFLSLCALYADLQKSPQV